MYKFKIGDTVRISEKYLDDSYCKNVSKLVGTVIGYKDYNKLREGRDNSAGRYNYIVHFDNGIIIDFWHEAIRKAVGKCPKYLLVKSPHIQ